MAANPAHTNNELMARLEQLSQEVQLLQQVVDELRSEIQWASRNGRLAMLPAPMHITSMPLDPLAQDWSTRLNRHCPEDLPAEESVPPAAGRQQELW